MYDCDSVCSSRWRVHSWHQCDQITLSNPELDMYGSSPSPQIFIFHTCLNRVSCGLVLSRFHLLGEFDDGKRSCRKRLADHNRRRRKPQPNASQPSAESIGMKSGDDDRANGMWPTLASSGYHQFLHCTPCSKVLSFRLRFLLFSSILVLIYNATRLVSSTFTIHITLLSCVARDQHWLSFTLDLECPLGGG